MIGFLHRSIAEARWQERERRSNETPVKGRQRRLCAAARCKPDTAVRVNKAGSCLRKPCHFVCLPNRKPFQLEKEELMCLLLKSLNRPPLVLPLMPKKSDRRLIREGKVGRHVIGKLNNPAFPVSFSTSNTTYTCSGLQHNAERHQNLVLMSSWSHSEHEYCVLSL
jgi:hypothetical protein